VGEIGRDARGQGWDKKSLDKSRGDENRDVMRRRADEARCGDHQSAGKNNRLDGISIREHAERQIGQGDTEDNHRHRQRRRLRIDAEFILDYRQHRLSDVNGSESGPNQKEYKRVG
jgi:hypothetical protein